MKKIKKAAICLLTLASLVSVPAMSFQADAASVGDVIAAARAIGMPESEIQSYVAQYGGRDYTSEQCDQAIAALYGMKDKYSGNSSSDSDSSSDDNSSSSDTSSSTEAETETETNKYTKIKEDFFNNKTSEEKISEIISMTDKEAKEFWNSLDDSEKLDIESLLNKATIEDLKSDALEVAEELGLDVETTEEETETTKETTTSTSETTTTETTTTEAVETTENSSENGTSEKGIYFIVGVIVIIAAALIGFIGIKLGRKDKK